MLTSIPTSLTFITLPQTLAAGAQSGTIKVELLNQLGQPMAALANTVVTLSGPGMAFQSFPGNTPITSVTILKGASTASFKFDDTVAGSDTLTAASAGLKSALQAETIVAGAPTQIVISPPTKQPVIAGVVTPISIKLEDQFGNLAAAGTTSHVVTITRTPHGPTYTVTTGTVNGEDVALFSSSTTAQFFASATSTTPITSIVIPKGSTGVTVYYKDLTPGMSVVTVDTANLGSFSETETVTEGASQIVFANAPQTFTAGVLTTANLLTVELKAADGTVAFATTPVVVMLSSTSGTGSFHDAAGDAPAITSVTIGVGMSTASFTYSDTTAGTPTLTAASSPLTSAMQTETVVAAAATHFGFTTSSTTFPEITPSPTITVTQEDQFGNPVAAGAGGQVVMLSTSSATGTFQNPSAGPGNVTSVTIPANSTSASFTYTDTTPGNYTLTAHASSGPVFSSTLNVTVTAAASQITLSPAAISETAGVKSSAITVTLRDSNGLAVNATTNLTVDLSSTSATGEFLDASNNVITSVVIPAGSSSATFFYSDTTAGNASLTGVETTDGFTSNSVLATTVAAAPTQVVFVTSSPQSVLAGNPLTVTVQLEDQYGNAAPAQGTAQNVLLSDGGNGGTFSPSATLTFPVAGSASQTVTYTNTTPGTYTLSLISANGLTDTSTLTVNVVSNINPVSITNFSFETPVTASSTDLTGTTNNGWTYGGTGSSGVSLADQPSPQSAFFTAAPPDGSQGAYMFTGATISQTLTFPAGTYTLSFWMIEPTNIAGTASISVLVDGNQVLAPTPPASTNSWNQVTTSSFTVTGGTHTIEFVSSGVAFTVASIDDVTIS